MWQILAVSLVHDREGHLKFKYDLCKKAWRNSIWAFPTKSKSRRSPLIIIIRSLCNDDGHGNENGKKSNRLRLQQLCTCITLFCSFLCRRCTTTTWKCLISRCVRDVNKRLSFSLKSRTLIQSFRIQLQKSLPTFDEMCLCSEFAFMAAVWSSRDFTSHLSI